MADDDARLRAGALPSVNAAQQPDANPLALWHPVPGLGKILRRGRLEASDAINRVPRVQALASSWRLGPWAQASHGNRAGSSGPNIGKAPRPGAVSAAAGLVRRAHPAGQPRLARGEKTPGKGTAFTLGAHQGSRAVDALVKRKVAVARHRGLNDDGRGGGALDASLAPKGCPC
jgi:hypothetical protein